MPYQIEHTPDSAFTTERTLTRDQGQPGRISAWKRWITLASAIAFASVTLVSLTSGAAEATPTVLCGVHEDVVPEYSTSMSTGTYLTPGKSLQVTGSGSIWAGVVLTGANGPAGWSNTAGSGFPQPAARAFNLLARIGSGPWTYIGSAGAVTNTGQTTELLQFRVNDNVAGNGSGAFTATYSTCWNTEAPASPYAVNQVVALHSGKCLDVAYASTAHAADVIQGTCWGGTNQQWTARPVGSGYYEIVARHSGKCLDVAYASTAHMADVIQGTCWGGANQQWRFA